MPGDARPPLGFIGLGKMGAPMARRLIDHGYPVWLFDARKAAVDALVRGGGKPAASPMDVGANAAIVFTCLPSLAAIRGVMLGRRGVCHGGQATIYVDLSTTGPEFARRIAARLAPHGIGMLDAPVTGGVLGARQGTLAIIVSGHQRTLDRARPVIEHLGKVFYVSAQPGHAQMMKLINQLLSTTSMAVTCEGFVLGVKAGLDPDVMLEVLNAGSGRNSATAVKFPRAVLTRSFDNGANLEISHKDISLCVKEAQRLGVELLVGSAVKRLWARGMRNGGAKRDSTRLITHLERAAGVRVAGKAAKRRRTPARPAPLRSFA